MTGGFRGLEGGRRSLSGIRAVSLLPWGSRQTGYKATQGVKISSHAYSCVLHS